MGRATGGRTARLSGGLLKRYIKGANAHKEDLNTADSDLQSDFDDGSIRHKAFRKQQGEIQDKYHQRDQGVQLAKSKIKGSSNVPAGKASGGKTMKNYAIKDASGGGKGRMEKIKAYGAKPAS